MKKFKLSDIPKREPFEAPDGYLDRLPYLIQERLQHEPAPVPPSLGNWLLRPQLQLAMAAVLLLLASGLLFFRQPPAEAPQDSAFTLLDEVSDQEVVEYLEHSSRLSMQEIHSVAEWKDEPVLMPGLPADGALEEEVLKNIEIYSAEEIW